MTLNMLLNIISVNGWSVLSSEVKMSGLGQGEMNMSAGAKRRWEELTSRMWDLEEAMRREEDARVFAKLEDQWHFVIMEISEIEAMYGGFTQRPSNHDTRQSDRERESRREVA